MLDDGAFIENLHGHTFSGLCVLSKLNLRKRSFTNCPPNLILSHFPHHHVLMLSSFLSLFVPLNPAKSVPALHNFNQLLKVHQKIKIRTLLISFSLFQDYLINISLLVVWMGGLENWKRMDGGKVDSSLPNSWSWKIKVPEKIYTRALLIFSVKKKNPGKWKAKKIKVCLKNWNFEF